MFRRISILFLVIISYITFFFWLDIEEFKFFEEKILSVDHFFKFFFWRAVDYFVFVFLVFEVVFICSEIVVSGFSECLFGGYPEC